MQLGSFQLGFLTEQLLNSVRRVGPNFSYFWEAKRNIKAHYHFQAITTNVSKPNWNSKMTENQFTGDIASLTLSHGCLPSAQYYELKTN